MNYYLAAMALRAVSLSETTRALYRWLGNRKRHRKLSEARARWVIERLREVPFEREPALLELGTGWIHAYSLYPALIFDAEIHCFDVSDNRSFAAFRNMLPELRAGLERLEISASERTKALARIKAVEGASDFESAYRSLDMRYAIAPEGRLPYGPDSFDVIYSVDVLEHVDAALFERAAEDWLRVLRPGGRMVAQVGLDDHLAHYDPRRSKKHYLRHSDATFRRLLENRVQYINRIPAGEMIAKLERAGFLTVAAERQMLDETLEVHSDYATQPGEDLVTWRLNLVLEKPAGAAAAGSRAA